MPYKPLSEPQPSPLPPGTGIVGIEHDDGVWWHPVFLVDENQLVPRYEYFTDPHGVFLSYKDRGGKGRHKAIKYLWRRYVRGDLEYSRGWQEIEGKHWKLDYCSAGITGNLYQHGGIKVAEAASRLMLPKSFILRLIKDGEINAHLHSSKERSKGRDFFTNYYILSLAHLEAYLDHHGYGKEYPSYAERQRELGTTRKLPVIIWCV